MVSQYQTEIPERRVEHIEYRIHMGSCRACGRPVAGRHARQTSTAVGSAASQLGPRALALDTHQHMHMIRAHGALHDRHLTPLADLPQHIARPYRYLATQHLVAAFRHPDHVVLDVPHTVLVLPVFDHLAIIQHGGWKLSASKAEGLDLVAEAKQPPARQIGVSTSNKSHLCLFFAIHDGDVGLDFAVGVLRRHILRNGSHETYMAGGLDCAGSNRKFPFQQPMRIPCLTP